jgi:uncharacterized protein YeaO (DUF488 family)
VIRVKRVYDAADVGDGTRILVDRLWPRGLSKERAAVDLWFKDVAPSDELRRWFGHNPERWTEFKKRYHRELESRSAPLKELRAPGRSDVITLLFAASDTDHNNAVALREYLEKREGAGAGPGLG